MEVIPNKLNSSSLEKNITELIQSKFINIKKSEDKIKIYEIIECLTSSLLQIPIERAEEDVLFYLVPGIKLLLQEVYINNADLSKNDKSILEENIQFTLALISSLENVLEFAIANFDNEQIFYLENVLCRLPECLCLSFKYCKDSQNICKNFMEDCSDILTLYKNTQETYLKYLKFINSLNMMEHEDKVGNLVHIIFDCMDILFGLNVKCLVETWKSYCSILEKYQMYLVVKNDHYSIVFSILAHQITSLLKFNDNENNTNQNIKLSGFLMKVSLIIANACLKSDAYYHKKIHIFFGEIYKIYTTLRENKEIKEMVESCLINSMEMFISNNLLDQNYFDKIYSLEKMENNSCGCVYSDIYLGKFFINLNNDIDLSSSFELYLKHFFNHILYDKTIPHDVFVDLSSDVSVHFIKVFQQNPDLYNINIEAVLLENLLSDNFWCQLVAQRMWIYILRNSTDDALENFLLGFIEQIADLYSICKIYSDKVIFIKSFLCEVVNLLPEHRKNGLFQIYNPLNGNNIWKMLEISEIPTSSYHLIQVVSLLVNEICGMESYTSFEQFIELINHINVVLNISSASNEELASGINKLWQLNYSNVDVTKGFTKYFLQNVLQITLRCIFSLSNSDILLVLKQLKLLCKCSNSYKIFCCQLLKSLSDNPFDFDEYQNSIHSTISDIFNILLKNCDAFILEMSVEVFEKFSLQDKQPVIVNNVHRMLPDMQKIFDEYKNKNFRNSFLNLQSDYRLFRHTCVQINTIRPTHLNKNIVSNNGIYKENSLQTDDKNIRRKNNVNFPLCDYRSDSNSLCKKIKLDVDEADDVDDVLQRIKGEIKCLEKVMKKQKASQKQGVLIKQLMGQLELCLDFKG